MQNIKIVSFCISEDLSFIMFYIFKRIGWSFIGFMCLLYCISMLVNKNVKVGEKFFKFDDAGYLYLLPALGFLLLGIYGFWMAF